MMRVEKSSTHRILIKIMLYKGWGSTTMSGTTAIPWDPPSISTPSAQQTSIPFLHLPNKYIIIIHLYILHIYNYFLDRSSKFCKDCLPLLNNLLISRYLSA